MGSISKKAKFGALVSALTCMAIVALPGLAQADVTPTVDAEYGSTVPGAHGYYKVTHHYTYSPTTDDLLRYAIDGPAGLVGNPNAVPNAERCTEANFVAGSYSTPSCPAASLIGTAAVTFAADADDSIEPGSIGPLPNPIPGKIFILQNASGDPDAPTTLGTILLSGTRTRSIFSPVTSGDFRIRAISQENASVIPGLHIKRIVQILNANAGNGNPFLTNPTRCDAWQSYIYANAVTTNTNVDSDPDGDGVNNWVSGTGATTTPDCTTLPTFSPTGTSVFSTVKRDTSPTSTFTIGTPNIPGGSVPKKLVTTFPKTLSVNGSLLPISCTIAQRNSSTCPEASKIGTATVATPLITSGLTGTVYSIENPGGGVPNLSIYVTGAISFRLDSVNQLVGNQIISTFDNLPQVGFTSFGITLTSGTNGFLKIRACPDNNGRPQDGPITHAFTSYAGQTSTVVNDVTFAECVGVTSIPKPPSCVHHNLKVNPVYSARANLAKAELFVDGHRVATQKKLNFVFEYVVDDLKPGLHDTKVRAFYKSGKKAYKTARFRRCG